jgi:hypothetical protein
LKTRRIICAAFFIQDRVASATAPSVKESAAIWPAPSGSCSAIAEAATPMTGTYGRAGMAAPIRGSASAKLPFGDRRADSGVGL